VQLARRVHHAKRRPKAVGVEMRAGERSHRREVRALHVADVAVHVIKTVASGKTHL